MLTLPIIPDHDTPLLSAQGGALVMRAKWYRRKDRKDRYIVYLNLNGERYTRGHYDAWEPIHSERMANRLCERINGAIEDERKSFNPTYWFSCHDKSLCFSVYSQAWLDRKLPGLAGSTQDQYVRAINEAVSFFKDKDIRTFRKGDFEDYLKHLPDNLSLKTKRNRLGVLGALFSDALDREDIGRKPSMPKIIPPEPDIKWISAEWQNRIIAALPAHDRPIFEFMRSYGLRVSEAIKLTWDCVYWDAVKPVVLFRKTKEKRNKYLPLTTEVKAILEPIRQRWVLRGQIPNGAVFINQYNRIYSRTYLFREWRKAIASVGAPYVTIHQGMRTSKISQLLNRGESLQLVSAFVGHRDTRTTKRYTGIKAQSLERLVR